MIVVCAWCQKVMGEKEPLEDKGETHTICPTCYAKEIKLTKQLKEQGKIRSK